MKKRYNLGLFIGRFQPFHKGHLSALEFSLNSCTNLIVGIGSAQKRGTEKNPLSSTNRIKIIKAGLKGTGADRRLKFMMIPDFEDNDLWFGYIMQRLPEIEVVFSGTPLVKSIFRSHNIKVITPPWNKRKRLSATVIRKIIRRGERWQDRIPKGAIKMVARNEDAIRRGGQGK